MLNFVKLGPPVEESERLNTELRAYLSSIGAAFPPTFWTAGWPQIRLGDTTPTGRALEKAGRVEISRWKGRLVFRSAGLLSNDLNPFPHGTTRLTIVRWGDAPDECGQIVVGEHSTLNATSITSYIGVHIGRHVLFGPGVVIMDCDGHPVDRTLPDQREHYKLAPVTIGDHAWLGLGCTIMKGVTIGHHAVVATQSVVVKDVPPHCIVAGNPARIVKDLRTDPEVVRRGLEQLGANT